MLKPDEQELLDYVTNTYGQRDKPAQKDWTFEEHFNFFQEELEEMLFDLFTRYGIEHSNFNIDDYFMPEFYWWQFKLKKEWQDRQFKTLTLGMIIESAKAGRWLYD
ncbi:DUF1493 family protein [Rahnella sp. C60]|uniref:DUF1493 family protein n=1 Tax=Rahnella perminowiae TaxID=2816244 RepID=UPI001C26DB77|nr:DUF1493 family protein [Rahnella perminowiae]MBU9808600.1 DUF1493 family protein [Rahnella perminowiae]MBU9818125.1 DUF1493 family protein [Rahnella perminowiae]UJD90028.1 DUF1493 family protein [Rahnella aquatilis]